MYYQSIPRVNFPLGQVVTGLASKGVNLRDLPQLIKPDYAQRIENYFVRSEGRLVMRKGQTEFFSVAGTVGANLNASWTNDEWVFGYGTTVAIYNRSTGLVTNVKTDFVTSDPFSGERYGDYFLVCNGGNRVGRISKTLNFDAQTANFTVNEMITGGTSGAMAVILEQSDAGATGTLTLGSIVGVFQDNEIITGSSGGSATVNGALGYTFAEIAGAPKAKVLKVIGARLFAGNLEGNPGGVAYSDYDTGTNPPFNDWTVGILADDPGLVSYKNIGGVNSIVEFGQFVVVFGDFGKFAFYINVIDSAGSLTKVDVFQLSRLDQGGATGAINTARGLFYLNESGLRQLLNLGNQALPLSDSEFNATLLLGPEYFVNVDQSSADITFDERQNLVFVTYANDSAVNNEILAYDPDAGTITFVTGWNINRFYNNNGEIYGSDSTEPTIYKLFEGYTDDGAPIGTYFQQELDIGGLETIKDALTMWCQGKLSRSSSITLSFDKYDKTGVLDQNVAQYTWNLENGRSLGVGYDEFGYDEASYDGDLDLLGLFDSFEGINLRLRNIQRLVLKISCSDKVPHQINWVKIQSRVKRTARRRGLSRII